MAETLCAPSFIENLDHRNQTAAHVCVRVALKCHCWGHISMSSIYTYRSICIHIDDFLHDNHRPIPRKRCKQPTNQASTMLYFSACRFIIIIFPFFRSLNAVFPFYFECSWCFCFWLTVRLSLSVFLICMYFNLSINIL